MTFAALGDDLTARELQVLRYAAYGDTQEETGVRLQIARNTVQQHRKNLLRKLGARNMANAVALGYESGLLGRQEAA